MTETEIAAVMEGARKVDPTIDAQNKAGDKLERKYKNIPPDVLVSHENETVAKVTAIFDEKGAARLLAMHPEHPDAALVREAAHRVANLHLVRDHIAAVAKTSMAFDRIAGKEKQTQGWWSQVKAMYESQLGRLRPLQTRAEMLRTKLQPDEVDNIERVDERLKLIRNSIADSEQLLAEIQPNVAAEQFVLNGGIEVRAQELWEDFDANEIAALQRYQGKRVRLSGRVERISADFMNKPQVHLRTKNRFQSVTISGVNANEAAQLKKGTDISVICLRISEVIGSPMCDVKG